MLPLRCPDVAGIGVRMLPKYAVIASRRIEGIEKWPNIDDFDKYVTSTAHLLIQKAIKSCLLAVETYNKPTIEFRSEGFIVMMMISWTSLFHAIFENEGTIYQYPSNEKEEANYWDLSKCIKEYDGLRKKEIEANLAFLIEIRNMIVHKYIPALDEKIFGECQACLLNLEFILKEFFGKYYSIKNSLAFSLQFSDEYKEEQIESIKKKELSELSDIEDFIKYYRESLPVDVFQSPYYSFRVFLIPKIGNHLNTSDAAIEFVKYNPESEEELKEYEKFLVVIKERRNLNGYYRAGEVCAIIYEKLKDKMPINWKFSYNYHHPKCEKYFKINHQGKVDERYCIYVPSFKRYLYSEAWTNFLVDKLSNVELYKKIFKKA